MMILNIEMIYAQFDEKHQQPTNGVCLEESSSLTMLS